MFSKQKLLLLLALLVLGFGLSACDESKAKDEGKGGDKNAAAQGAPPPPTVTVAKPLVQPVDEWHEFSGRFEATDTVDVRSRVSGYLTQVLFKDGTMVQKGDPLFVIDPRPFEAILRQKQADRALAQSKVAAAENDYQRAAELYKTGDVSQQLLDQRKSAAGSAKAAVASAQAAVDAAALDVTYTKITAPITGRIGRNLISLGNLVNPGESLLTTIVSMDPIYFYFDIDEKTYLDYARAHPDQTKDHLNIPVMVALSDENDYRHVGTMDFIDNAMDTGTGTMRGRAVLENPKLYFAPGMFGRVRITIGTLPTGVLIPDSAITIDQSRKIVFVVGANNMVESRTIETGQMDKGLRVITKGLDGSETIIINGLQRAHEGAPVTPEQGAITPTAEGAAATVTDTSAPDATASPDQPAAAPADGAAGAPPAGEAGKPDDTLAPAPAATPAAEEKAK